MKYSLLRNLKIKTRLWILFFSIQFLVGVIVFILYNNSQKLLYSTDWIIHTQVALSQIESIKKKIVDLETGQRGFLITGNEKYLVPFNTSMSEIYADITAFKKLTSDNPVQSTEIDRVKDLLDQKIAELNLTIKLRREVGFEAAQEVVNSDLGKDLMGE